MMTITDAQHIHGDTVSCARPSELLDHVPNDGPPLFCLLLEPQEKVIGAVALSWPLPPDAGHRFRLPYRFDEAFPRPEGEDAIRVEPGEEIRAYFTPSKFL